MSFTRYLFAALVSLAASPAVATLITFDDLPANIDIPGWTDPGETIPRPLTTQYEHLGVSFGEGDPELVARGEAGNDGAAITDYDAAAVSGTNAIMDFYGPGMSFTFIGDQLPGYVSFNVTGASGVGVWGSAEDALGNEVASFQSDGFWGLPELSSPAIPGQFIELEADSIKTVYLGNFYNRRSYTNLDNLYFSSSRPVTEPATWTLFAGALFALALGRSRAVRRYRPGKKN